MHSRFLTRTFLTTLIIWGVLVVCFSLASLRFHPKEIRYDGVFYFIQLRSLHFDGDFDFRNEAERFPWVTRTFGTPLADGRLANPFAIGSAILWTPFYGLADGYCHVRNLFLHTPYNCNGYIACYVKAVIIGTAFWSATGVLLLTLAIKRLGGRVGLAGMTTIALVLSSPLVFYILFEADYAHGNAFFTIALLCTARWRLKTARGSCWRMP